MLKKFLSKFVSSSTIHSTKAFVKKIDTEQTHLYEPNQQELNHIIQLPTLTGKAPGYVYFVQEHMTGSFKIGKAKHIDKRMNVFNVKLPFENKLIFLVKSADYHQTELVFHEYFSDKRLEGEWFNLTQEDLAWITNGHYTDKIHKTIRPPLEVTKQLTANKVKAEDKPLSLKQIEFAQTLITKLEQEYEVNVSYSKWTQKDLNRLSGYFRFKNNGALTNLVESGVLTKK